MLSLRGITLGLVVASALATTGTAQAGWQGVFQVTCFNCSSPTTSAYYGSACCNPCNTCCTPCYSNPCCEPCQQVVATTNYVQRCYYQPVTCYRNQTYYEQVTTYRTSYYYEPTTCYRYSCCYDPCTCSYRQVATPYTSYRLRSQCCPVTSFVQRCCQVPVTTYRKCCYWEAQTCYSLVDPCTGATTPLNGTAAPATTTPAVTETPSTTQPGVQEFRGPATPGTSGSPLYEQQKPAVPAEGSGSSYRPNTQRTPTFKPVAPAAPRAPIVPKLDRIAFETDASGPGKANVVGQVVTQANSAPRSGARLLFVSDAASGQQESATADPAGKFRVSLTSGNWLVYVRNEQGQAIFHSKVHVKGSETQQVTLVSR